jgi:hypothetical protein
MDEKTRRGRELGALENIVTELVRLRVLKEYELGVRLEWAPKRAALTCLTLTRRRTGFSPRVGVPRLQSSGPSICPRSYAARPACADLRRMRDAIRPSPIPPR